MDNDDERCCGTGTCIINAEGLCWCGQQWNGTAMCRPETAMTTPFEPNSAGTPLPPLGSTIGIRRTVTVCGTGRSGAAI